MTRRKSALPDPTSLLLGSLAGTMAVLMLALGRQQAVYQF